MRQLKVVRGFFGSVLWLSFLFSSTSMAVPNIAWTPSSVSQKVNAGVTVTVPVSFTASENINNVVVRVVPELGSIVTTNPSSFTTITKGQTVKLNLIVSGPENSPGTFKGTIQLKSKENPQKTYAKPLPATITVAGAIVGPEGGTVTAPDGISVTLAPGAIDYEALLNIETVPTSNIVAPLVVRQFCFDY